MVSEQPNHRITSEQSERNNLITCDGGALRIGIFGGAFNPPHKGHLFLARKAKELLKLDKIIFIPAGRAPHRRIERDSSRTRYKMVSLAIKNYPYFKVSDIEIKRKSRSFTIETVKKFKRNHSKNTKIYFIIGGDEALKIQKWKEYRELLKVCKFIVFPRKDFNLKSIDPWVKERVKFLNLDVPDISSSEIRSRTRFKKAIYRFVSPQVERYIKEHKLYKGG